MTNKTDTTRAAEIATLYGGQTFSDSRVAHAWLQEAIAQAFAEIRKEFENLSCSKCGNPWGDGWIPIESAPKDGTRVLTYTYAHNTIDMAYCDGDRWNTETLFIAPTHWMPLPAAPKGGYE